MLCYCEETNMQRLENLRKVLFFGIVGAVGCLLAWVVGEGYLLVVSAKGAILVEPPQPPPLVSARTNPPDQAPPITPILPPAVDPESPPEFSEPMKRDHAQPGKL